jgi:hypothetical protein
MFILQFYTSSFGAGWRGEVALLFFNAAWGREVFHGLWVQDVTEFDALSSCLTITQSCQNIKYVEDKNGDCTLTQMVWDPGLLQIPGERSGAVVRDSLFCSWPGVAKDGRRSLTDYYFLYPILVDNSMSLMCSNTRNINEVLHMRENTKNSGLNNI